MQQERQEKKRHFPENNMYKYHRNSWIAKGEPLYPPGIAQRQQGFNKTGTSLQNISHPDEPAHRLCTVTTNALPAAK